MVLDLKRILVLEKRSFSFYIEVPILLNWAYWIYRVLLALLRDYSKLFSLYGIILY